MAANDIQVGGQHYKVPGLQHWDLSVLFGWDPFQYQITKYVMRWRDKNGLIDVEKVVHFAQKYVEEIKAGRVTVEQRLPTLPRDCWLELLGVAPHAATDIPLDLAASVWAQRACTLVPNGELKADSYKNYSYEGAKDGKDLYRCKHCREHVAVPLGAPPVYGHRCTAVRPVEQATVGEA